MAATPNALVKAKNYVVERKHELESMMPNPSASSKFIRTVHQAMTLNPKIVECTPVSVMAVCMKAAVDGLLLDGKEAALVPLKTGGALEANYRPMVAGINKLINQSEKISSFNTHVVYENDPFEVEYGLEPKLVHKPTLTGEPGPAIGVYAVCKFTDGEADVEFMTTGEVERIRQTSPAKNNDPWKLHWGEMARKTVTHRIAKRLPISPEAKVIVERIEEMYDMTEGKGAAVEPKKRGGGAEALRNKAAIEEAEAGDVIDLDSTLVDDTDDTVDAGAGERQDAF